jgi:SNF2 family DNA or RNA helicase
VGPISRFRPDLVILDEAQRIKNFNTKTADAVKNIPCKHAMVLTGTPLENKLEDVYSIVQFLDPDRLSPLWSFAADHFMLSRDKKGKILGYRNLGKLHQELQSIVIRRKKKDVLDQLPDEIVNNYYIELSDQQYKIHGGYTQSLLPLINKKFLTPMDLRRIQELLLKMRQVCNSTYLIDRKTQISPKLKELESILTDLGMDEGRKIVIFSEWTTMTYLIARQLSNAGISFVELSGKIPVNRRQALIDEFTHNPDCRVFLSTDAGGTGLNLQAADCVINFELPWNPARMNQRIGRISRIGQKSGTVNVINLIAKKSIEERIFAGIQLKTDLFQGVFDGTTDMVEFSREKRTELLNQLREMMQEEPEPVIAEQRAGEEIPEETPHYLNPSVFENQDTALAYDAEEASADENTGEAAAVFADQPPEKMEEVLNTGMAFIGGLLEMATGKKIETSGSDDKMIRIDKDTGEVTMKFKMPGF